MPKEKIKPVTKEEVAAMINVARVQIVSQSDVSYAQRSHIHSEYEFPKNELDEYKVSAMISKEKQEIWKKMDEKYQLKIWDRLWSFIILLVGVILIFFALKFIHIGIAIAFVGVVALCIGCALFFGDD